MTPFHAEDEIIGLHGVGTIIPEKDSNGRSMRKIMEKIAKSPEEYEYYEVENMRRNGERVWVAWTNKAVRNTDGDIVEYLCIGHDITKAKAAEQEMARMRHYLQNIVDSMPSILVGVDLAGRITQWNCEARKLTGISQENILGKELAAVFPSFRDHMDMVRQAISEKTAKKVVKVRHPAKSRNHYADIMVYPIVVKDVEGAVIRVDDVTARVRMEDVMVQTEKMMSVGGLAAGMAHEINNPLGGMLQTTQNILRRISPELEGNIKAAHECGIDLASICCYLEKRKIIKFLDDIRLSGERAHRTVENMLNFSRKSESRKIPVQLADLLDKTVALAAHDYDLKKKYDFRHIKIIRSFSRRMCTVPCVATEIEQVVLNLLRNAAQAMADGGTAGKPPCITLRLYRENHAAVIEVEDNGPGMNQSTLKRVFEPFFTTKDVGIGTGLGLSVSYFIITNNHQGTLEVESKPGKGTNFIIRLPLEPKHG